MLLFFLNKYSPFNLFHISSDPGYGHVYIILNEMEKKVTRKYGELATRTLQLANINSQNLTHFNSQLAITFSTRKNLTRNSQILTRNSQLHFSTRKN